MYEIVVAIVTFIGLFGASLISLFVSARLPARYREDETNNVVRLAASIFVVTTSLVLGLLLNSAKNTFEAIDRNVHGFATDLVVLDRSLRHYGPEAADVRQRLAGYVRRAVEGTWPTRGAPVLDDRSAEQLLDDVGDALAAIRPSDPVRADVWHEVQTNFQNVVKRRWVLIGWLVLIFASFGYRAPRNALVTSTFAVAAFLIAVAIYLIIDMDVPFSGPIQISPAPLLRAEAQMRR